MRKQLRIFAYIACETYHKQVRSVTHLSVVILFVICKWSHRHHAFRAKNISYFTYFTLSVEEVEVSSILFDEEQENNNLINFETADIMTE